MQLHHMGGVFIYVHTVLENSGSPSSNPDLFCTGPFAYNYHLTDGQDDHPSSIFSLASGHLELRYQKPIAIDWNFYSKENTGDFIHDDHTVCQVSYSRCKSPKVYCSETQIWTSIVIDP